MVVTYTLCFVTCVIIIHDVTLYFLSKSKIKKSKSENKNKIKQKTKIKKKENKNPSLLFTTLI